MNQDSSAVSPSRKERFPAWNRFWFTPADPTLLGLIRICCGAITVYTLFIYSFRLQDFMGEHAWQNLEARLKDVHEMPRELDSPLNYVRTKIVPAKTPDEAAYNEAFRKEFGAYPALPYPETTAAREFAVEYRRLFKRDVQMNGLVPPQTKKEMDYVVDYTEKFLGPPPAYPNLDDPNEIAAIEKYIFTYGRDPRVVYAQGIRVWSLWFDITDPAGMAIAHGVVVLIAFLFMIGFCTRITSALTWMASLWYIHRSTAVLFGVDTMQTITLLYLMIGPSGAALSVDRLIARWWSRNKLRIVNRWRGLWGKPALSAEQIVPALYSPTPVPSVSANVAYRLIQIHLCIIYLIAGTSKLLGPTWWSGTAVWGTLANYEFAPMQYPAYMWFLRQVAEVRWIFNLFLTVAGLFTLAFEISYAFLIWQPRTRWWLLAGAILLHGFIGFFMGLKTFSMMMLVMNMAFLSNAEAHWFLRFFNRSRGADTSGGAAKPPSQLALEGSAATSPGSKTIQETATKVKRK